VLPQEMHGACGMTCWRRLRGWQAAGVGQTPQMVLLGELRGAVDDQLWCVDGTILRAHRCAVGGGKKSE